MQTPTETWEIPGYDIQDKIGEGGTGQVYRATQLSLHRPVAIKILNPSLQDNSPLLAFHRESRLMASLAHPNVVAIHDCGQIERRVNGEVLVANGKNGHSESTAPHSATNTHHYFLVMEHVAGQSLREQMVEGRPWSRARAGRVLDAVAQALSYIHSKGILHLDLKPENVLYTPEGVVKVTDFGLAIPQGDAHNVSDLAWVQGSVDYCSPEQRFGLAQDQRSDVFSLAVLSYELLTGRVPGRYYVPASQRNPRLPPALDEVLRRGLARDPSERYATIEDFRGDLSRVLNPPGHGMSFWATLAATVTLVLGASFVLLSGRSGDSSLIDEPPRPVRAWHIFGHPEATWGFETADEKAPRTIAGTPVTSLCLQSLPPGQKLDPQVPDWPYPLPSLVLTAPDRWCFFHPLEPQAFGPSEVANWSKLFEIPPLAVQNNYVRAGHFEGNCLGGETAIWRIGATPAEKDLPPITTLGTPEDRPGTQALCLTKTSRTPDTEMVCYQWLAREPRRPKTIMILRYRARAETGDASVAIGVDHRLEIPKTDTSPLATRLRGWLAVENPPPRPDVDFGQFWVNDWIRPSSSWQTYCVVWQWPPYCTSNFRNITIHFGGQGKIWIDNVELFTWDREMTP